VSSMGGTSQPMRPPSVCTTGGWPFYRPESSWRPCEILVLVGRPVCPPPRDGRRAQLELSRDIGRPSPRDIGRPGLPEDLQCDLELTAALEKRLQLMPVDALIDSSNSQIRLQTQLLKVADLVQLDPTHFLDALDHGPVTAETVIS